MTATTINPSPIILSIVCMCILTTFARSLLLSFPIDDAASIIPLVEDYAALAGIFNGCGGGARASMRLKQGSIGIRDGDGGVVCCEMLMRPIPS